MSKDLVQAYMWCSLAAKAGHGKGKQCRAYTGKLMTTEQIAEARRLAAEWVPKRR